MSNLKKCIERAKRNRDMVVDFSRSNITIKSLAEKYSLSVNVTREIIDRANYFVDDDGLIVSSSSRRSAVSLRRDNQGLTNKKYLESIRITADGFFYHSMTLASDHKEKGKLLMISELEDGKFAVSIGENEIIVGEGGIERMISKLKTCLN